jgi:WD40 repeat protein
MAQRPWFLAAVLAAAALRPQGGARADDKPGEPAVLGTTAAVHAVAFSPDGKTLASADDDGVITLWDVATRKARTTMSMPAKFVRALAYSPDGKTVASGDRKKLVQLWDAATGKPLGKPLDQGASVWAVAFSPDGKTLAAGGNGAVKLWDVAAGKEAATIRGSAFVKSLMFSPSGKQLAVGGGYVIRLCDVEKAREYASLEGSKAAYSPDGKTLAVVRPTTVALCDLTAGGKDRLVLEGEKGGLPSTADGEMGGIAFSPDSKSYRKERGSKFVTCSSPASYKLAATVVSVSSKALATAGRDRTVRLWDTQTGKELAVFKGHTGAALSAAFSPDGKRIASGGDDTTVRLWDVPAPK